MDLINILFITAFIINIVTAFYAFYVKKALQGGALQRVSMATALSVLVFGIHHLMLIVFHQEYLLVMSESIQALSSLILVWAIYELYKTIKV